MSRNRYFPASSLVAFLLLLLAAPLLAKDDWLPITPADLSYKDPNGSAAVMLYLQADTDDQNSIETVYVRVKVLTDEGKKQGDVEIPYVKDITHVEDIQARVIQPDGSIQEFDGQVYDKVIVKSRVLKVLTRAFTLPAVQPGSILEYRYKMRKDQSLLLNTYWDLQRDLPVKKAHFSLRRYTGATTVPLRLHWIGISLPSSVQPVKDKNGIYTLDMTDIPPFPDEQYATPEGWFKMTVRFIYSDDPDIGLEPDAYWHKKSTAWDGADDDFVSKRKAVDQEVASLLKPDDTPEAKLRKLYVRAQQIHNLSFDREKTEKEAKHDKSKDAHNADDVLKHGYGRGHDINLLLVALARSAGFEASLVWAAPRNRSLFHRNIRDMSELSTHLVLVKLNDKQLFLDPATLYCPFGMLSWEETGVSALSVSKNGGEFLTTTNPRSADAVTLREAALHLDPERGLLGTVTVSFQGLEALRWRLDQRDNDDAERRKQLEAEVARWLPTSATIDLAKVTGWDREDDPLVAQFNVTIPGVVTRTGKRLLLQTGLFQSNDTHPFQHPDRKLPVYFSYPFRELDDVVIDLPPGYQLESTPQTKTTRTDFALYQHFTSFANNRVELHRRFVMEGFLFLTPSYPTIRAFYDTVRAGDDDTIVLKGGAQ